MNENKRIIFLGDIHGDLNVIYRFVQDYDVKNTIIIQVGDFGTISKDMCGRKVSKYIKQLKNLDEALIRNGCKLWSILGNHDTRCCYSGSWHKGKFSAIEFLADYTTRKINGKSFLFIGGAVSVDRLTRVPNGYWFHDEGVVLKEDKIKKCDVLVTHTCRASDIGFFNDSIRFWSHERQGVGDPDLLLDLEIEATVMDKIWELSQPDFWFLGHFHQAITINKGKTRMQVLDINEFYEFRA